MFSSFPNELVIKILDTLASSDQKSCLTLCLVSSWTRRIALPHLLHTVVIRQRNRTAFNKGANNQHYSYVKQLWIGAGVISASSIITGLTSCVSITTLTASSDFVISFEFIDNPSPFQFLTHLCITHYPLIDSDTELISYMFPQLTHFTGDVHSARDLELHRALLRAYDAQLVMVVAHMYDFWHQEVVELVREARKSEKRIYMAYSMSFSQEKDRMEDVTERESVWDRARRGTRNLLGLVENGS